MYGLSSQKHCDCAWMVSVYLFHDLEGVSAHLFAEWDS